MADFVKLEIVGEAEFRQRLNAIAARMVGPEVGQVYLAAAQEVRDEARQEAPVSSGDVFGGKFGRAETRRPGTLRRSIVAFRSHSKYDPAAWARVNVFKGSVRAPHGHLIHFGTKDRRSKKGKVLAFIGRAGHLVFAKQVRGIRANPFFQRALQSVGPRALDRAAVKVAQIIEKDTA